MLRDRLMGGASWMTLRAADDEGAGGGGGDNGGGDAGGDKGDNQGDGAGADDEGAAGGKTGARDDGAAAEQQDRGSDGGAGGGEPAGADGAAAAAAATAEQDWRDKELSRRQRRIREEAAERARVEADNKALRELVERLAAGGDAGAADGAGDQGGGRTLTQADVQREAERIANERLRAAEADRSKAEFDRQCNTAVTQGRADYGAEKFDASMARLGQIGFFGDAGNDFENLNMVLQTDDPHGVMHEIGQNPAEYFRIMDMPPLRRHAEFVKLSLKAQATRDKAASNGQRRPSNAPPPVEGLRGNGGEVDNRYNDEASSADWHAAEEKREREYWQRKNAAFRGG